MGFRAERRRVNGLCDSGQRGEELVDCVLGKKGDELMNV